VATGVVTQLVAMIDPNQGNRAFGMVQHRSLSSLFLLLLFLGISSARAQSGDAIDAVTGVWAPSNKRCEIYLRAVMRDRVAVTPENESNIPHENFPLLISRKTLQEVEPSDGSVHCVAKGSTISPSGIIFDYHCNVEESQYDAIVWMQLSGNRLKLKWQNSYTRDKSDTTTYQRCVTFEKFEGMYRPLWSIDLKRCLVRAPFDEGILTMFASAGTLLFDFEERIAKEQSTKEQTTDVFYIDFDHSSGDLPRFKLKPGGRNLGTVHAYEIGSIDFFAPLMENSLWLRIWRGGRTDQHFYAVIPLIGIKGAIASLRRCSAG
jgi:hypothetical protein